MHKNFHDNHNNNDTLLHNMLLATLIKRISIIKTRSLVLKT